MPRRTKAANEDDVGVLRCPLYVPAQPTALKRLLHLASFSLSSSVAVLAQWRWKPELVVLVVPTLFCAPQALLLAKLAGAKSVMHVQDYEVDALFGLSIAKCGVLKRFAYAMERTLLCSEHPGIAVLAEPESVSALIEGIERCLALPQPNPIATAYAGEFLDKDRILERFLAEL